MLPSTLGLLTKLELELAGEPHVSLHIAFYVQGEQVLAMLSIHEAQSAFANVTDALFPIHYLLTMIME